jgi:hypothetical protein
VSTARSRQFFLGAGLLFLIVSPILASAPQWLSETPLYTLLALCPWILAALIVSNGLLDRSGEILYPTVIVGQTFYGSCDAVTVRSWRPGHSTEGLYVATVWTFGGVRGLSDGKAAVIGVRSGALGIPWVSRIAQGSTDLDFPMAK